MRILTRRSALVALGAGIGAGLAGCAAERPLDVAVARAATSAPIAPVSPVTTPPSFDLAAHSIDDPTSPWIVVNKRRPLTPRTFVPPDLRPVRVAHTNPPILRAAAAGAVEEMVTAAHLEHVHMISVSTYRPYDDQQRIFSGDLANLGRAGAEALTLRPGYSEHQTGLAIDIGTSSGACSLDACFSRVQAGEWAAANAWRYGFLLRYPKGDTHITGIEYEPWHFRYVGADLAQHLHEQGIATLEQCFALPNAPTYAA